MPKASPIQQSFNAGELSPLLYGRTDFEKYDNGLKVCKNYVPTVQGPLIRRPGTYFVSEVKDSTKATRLVAFEFSTTQAYVIEFGDQYLRFYMDNGQIVSGASAYEIASPYLEADLFQLKFAQSADVLYIAHPLYRPRKLTRTGHTAWTLTEIDFQDGPYLNINTETTTLVASAASGSVTVTASAVTGINNDTGFQSTDVGRLVRILDGSAWAWGEITAHTSTTVVTVEVKNGSFPTVATENWRLGAWSDTTGYPTCVTFFEDRLWFGGGVDFPQRIDGSMSGGYEAFSPTEADASVTDEHAIARTLSSNTVNNIRWLIDDERGLLVGTVGGEWIVRASNSGEAVTPTNIQAKRSTTYGSADIQPVRAGKQALYVQRAGRKMRELAYVFESDGFLSPDLTLLSEHITAPGIVEIEYQQEPFSTVWAVRGDGTLLGMAYARDQDVVGWHRHEVGGTSDADGTAAKVESVAVIPSADGTRDELWLVVQRWVNGAAVRHIEYMTKFWEEGDDQEDAFFVDSGLTYDGAATTNLTGLDHLEGETVSILADGAVHPDVTVTSGAITLQREASKVHAGLGYESDGCTLRTDAGAADGTAQGKTKRIHRVVMRLHQTLGLKTGRSADSLDTVTFRTSADAMGSPPALYSGDLEVPFEGSYDMDGYIYWRQDQPLPGTILAVMPQLHTQDR